MRNGERKPTILVVDDDLLLRTALAQYLEVGGYRCVVCGTGTEAVTHIADSKLDAALIDVHLPDMNGLALANVVRVQHGPKVPVVVMSGDSSTRTLAQLREAGASYFFPKPLQPRVLLDWLGQNLPRRSPDENEPST